MSASARARAAARRSGLGTPLLAEEDEVEAARKSAAAAVAAIAVPVPLVPWRAAAVALCSVLSAVLRGVAIAACWSVAVRDVSFVAAVTAGATLAAGAAVLVLQCLRGTPMFPRGCCGCPTADDARPDVVSPRAGRTVGVGVRVIAAGMATAVEILAMCLAAPLPAYVHVSAWAAARAVVPALTCSARGRGGAPTHIPSHTHTHTHTGAQASPSQASSAEVATAAVAAKPAQRWFTWSSVRPVLVRTCVVACFGAWAAAYTHTHTHTRSQAAGQAVSDTHGGAHARTGVPVQMEVGEPVSGDVDSAVPSDVLLLAVVCVCVCVIAHVCATVCVRSAVAVHMADCVAESVDAAMHENARGSGTRSAAQATLRAAGKLYTHIREDEGAAADASWRPRHAPLTHVHVHTAWVRCTAGTLVLLAVLLLPQVWVGLPSPLSAAPYRHSLLQVCTGSSAWFQSPWSGTWTDTDLDGASTSQCAAAGLLVTVCIAATLASQAGRACVARSLSRTGASSFTPAYGDAPYATAAEVTAAQTVSPILSAGPPATWGAYAAPRAAARSKPSRQVWAASPVLPPRAWNDAESTLTAGATRATHQTTTEPTGTLTAAIARCCYRPVRASVTIFHTRAVELLATTGTIMALTYATPWLQPALPASHVSPNAFDLAGLVLLLIACYATEPTACSSKDAGKILGSDPLDDPVFDAIGGIHDIMHAAQQAEAADAAKAASTSNTAPVSAIPGTSREAT